MNGARTRPDLLVAGAGLAGLYAAICAAAEGARVMLVTKGSLRASNSFVAQGGIAAAIGAGDSPDDHYADTVRAGRGLSDPAAVRVLVADAATRIAHLEALGVAFDRDASGLALGREGGHGRRRILHAGGAATGRVVAERLIAHVEAHPRVTVIEHTAVTGLLSDGVACGGAWLLGHDELRPVHAGMTLIAAGGAGALFQRTTNPAGALGDGIALAHRAGAAVSDMEFVQFHPTALARGDRAFLVSEAVRGEGAHLVDAAGRRFVDELAPRDVVAAAIQRRLAMGEESYLDLSHLDAAAIRRRFPNLVAGVAQAGLDLTRDRVPVAPAAHYLMGGIVTDLDGCSTLPGLYASGECARTGVHGANRLASNSLLECFVFSRRAVLAGLSVRHTPVVDAPPPPPRQRVPLAQLQERMWRDAGPVRTAEGLAAVCDWLEDRRQTDPVMVARLIALSALAREESRGAHVRADFPAEASDLERSLPCPSLQPQPA